MKKLLIYGLGDFATLVKHISEAEEKYSVIGFCADREFIKTEHFLDLPIHSIEEIGNLYSKNDCEIIVAAGYKSMLAREKMFERAKQSGFSIARLISERAYVDHSASIGENAILFPGVTVEPFSVIGNNCVVWSSAVLCHHSRVGDHCFIAAQALLGGRARVGRRSFLGFNSTILQDVSVGDDCLIAAKSLVLNDVSPSSKCVGAPARLVSMNWQAGVMLP